MLVRTIAFILALYTAPLGADSVCPSTAEPIPAPTIAVKHSTGLLWRVDNPGIPSSYLFGTIHLEDRRVLELPPAVEQAFVEADRLAVEIDLQPQAMAQLSEAMAFTSGGTLEEVITGPLYQRLADLVDSHYGLSHELLATLKPWAVFTVLSRPRPQTGKVLDQILQDRARALDKPVYGLESAAELVEVLDGMPMADQVAILKDTVCNYDEIIGQIDALTRNYLDRDLQGMVALNNQSHDDEALFDRLMERVLYQRNARILDRLETHLQAGNAFIAVGALHLPGDRGLLSGLERRGYRVVAEY
ncbi:MAG: TraB/GumN family protein [Gammaproteobacteria bacterium]|nr:TraB/GumN family protein [Gammaproteobacteria bacterium]